MKTKVIQVEDKTHTQAKDQAKQRGMLLRAYIQMLIDKDGRVLTRAKEKQ